MQKHTYNVFLTMAKLATKNVQKALEDANVDDDYNIEVDMKNEQATVTLVASIIKHQKSALKNYAGSATRLLLISADMPFSMEFSPGAIFVQSILNSNRARVYQKRLVDLYAAKIYLDEALKYDEIHHIKGTDSAVEYAKNELIRMYSYDFVNNFDIKEGIIRLDDVIIRNLSEQACDSKYTMVTMDIIKKKAELSYKRKFLPRDDFFLHQAMSKSENKKSVKEIMEQQKLSNESAIYKSPVPVRTKRPDRRGVKKIHVAQNIYQDVLQFAKKKKSVHFNLDNRHDDILRCSPSQLASKKQFASIELLSSHSYIFDFYDDAMPKNLDDKGVMRYYYDKECAIYLDIMNLGTDKKIKKKGNFLFFPDGKKLQIEPGLKAYEFLHKLNTMNSAVLGYNPTKSDNNWMRNAIRQAYVSEGNAEYRLSMIERRMKEVA